LGRRHWTQ